MRIRLAADVRASPHVPSGIGRYAFEFARRLHQDPRIALTTYTAWPKLGSAHLRQGKCRHGLTSNGLIRQLWGEIAPPLWSRLDRIDAYWSTTHRLPRGLSNRVVRLVTIHDLTVYRAPDTMPTVSRAIESWQLPSAIHRADVVVAVSQTTARAISQSFGDVTKGKIVVVPCGTTVFPSGTSPSASVRALVKAPVLSVGTLEPRKNIGVLIRAYAGMPSWLRTLHPLVIVGRKGWGTVDVDDLVRRAGIESNTVHVPDASDADLASLYARARCLVLISTYEGFGIPIIEAGRFGTPSIVSDRGALPETVGEGGIVVPADDPLAISRAMAHLLTDTNLRDWLGALARRNSQRYEWQQSVDLLVDTIANAVRARRHCLRYGL